MRFTEVRRRPDRMLARVALLGAVAGLGVSEPAFHPRPAGSAEALEAPGSSVVTPADLGASPSADPSLHPWRAEDAPVRAGVPSGFRLAGEPARFRVQALSVLPGETVSFAVPPTTPSFRYGAGSAKATRPGRWRWTAPRTPGIYALKLSAGPDTVVLNALVLHPASEVHEGFLAGYRVGRYRTRPLRGDPAYLPPRGFVEVRRADRDVLVSPHFTLGQFLCRQEGEPRFVALSSPLLIKLEALSDRLAELGYGRESLTVMSGFRTPAYNRAIGNNTDYSRHLWGDAADVYIDADGDGRMDDLDGDGTSGIGDARVLYRVAESLDGLPGVRPGGLGMYGAAVAHGPFVHVDARGRKARW